MIGCKCGAKKKGCVGCRREYERRYRIEHPAEGKRLETMVRYARLHVLLRAGKAKRGTCVKCGSPRVGPVWWEGGELTDVTWVCQKHRSTFKGKD